MTIEWKCANCGEPYPDRVGYCECPTNVIYRREEGKSVEHATKLRPLMMTLGQCPPGLFVFEGEHLGFKSEYKTESKSSPGVWQSDAYVVASGEYFWGGTSDPVARERLMVLPLGPRE